MIVNPKGQHLNDRYVVFDLETTGFSAKSDKIMKLVPLKSKTERLLTDLALLLTLKFLFLLELKS